jgi:hypothetical protein
MASLCALPGNPTIAFPATDKVTGNLLGSFSAWDSNPIPPSLFVIDKDMRTWTLNSRLSFESHPIAAGRVPNISTHPYFAAALMALSSLVGRTGCTACIHLAGCLLDIPVAGDQCRLAAHHRPSQRLVLRIRGQSSVWRARRRTSHEAYRRSALNLTTLNPVRCVGPRRSPARA